MARLKTILIDAREWSTSTGRYNERLVHYLQEVDNDHDYIVLQRLKDFDNWQPTNRHFRKVVTHFKEFTFAEQIGLLWQITKLKPDLVHFPMVQQPILYQGRVVTTMQDLTELRFTNPSKNFLVFKFKQRVYRWVNFIAARKSVALITPTEFVKDDVARTLRVNSRKITVTLEAGDTIEAAPEPLAEFEGKQFIMYLGRPAPHKNLGRIIDAFTVVKQTHPDLQLVLVGKTDALYRRHKHETKRKGISDVHFTGFLPDSQTRWLYEHCAAYVFASLSEGFGLPVLEAMAAGAPVVSTSATCSPEVYGDAAHYFDPLDVQDMAAKITEVIDNPRLRAKLSAAGKAQVKKYSWKRMAEQTLAVYERALGEK
jgi:glycosyltransferase involved in cell wall biosynthesis